MITMDDLKAVELALVEKGQASKRYKLGEIWELNLDEIREALATVPSARPEQEVKYGTGRQVMTNQEIIYFLNQVRKILLDDKSWLESTIQPINEAFDKAISALEKQIPKKPNRIKNKRNENLQNLYCSSCGSWIGMYNNKLKRGDIMYNILNGNICPYCGQTIDWKNETNE